MLSSLLITLREGLEAALIIGIVLAYLAQTGNRRAFRPVWLGTGLAVIASLIAGAAVYFTAGELTAPGEQIFEGVATLTAAGILTWMIFWMRRQAINIKGQLQAEIRSALGSGSSWGLVGLAFVAVAREGIETVLFLFAATRVAESAILSTSGGLIGLAVAIAIGYTIYKGTSRLNLRTFFNITSILLIFFAAGLLAHSIHEFQEIGFVPTVVEHVWDTSRVLSEESILGRFLTALFGYNANPSAVEVIVYLGYLGITLLSYFRPSRPKKREPVTAAETPLEAK